MSQSPPEERHHRAVVALLSEEPGGNQQFRLRVTGGSMAPLLRSGDHVIAVRVPPDDLCRGDLVVLQRDSELVTHRLIFHEKSEGWYTKGDNRAYPDPPVQEDAILGRVVAAESGRGRLDFSEPHWRVLNQLLGGLSRWEAVVVGTGRHLKSRTEPGDLPRSSPDKGGAGTIQVLMWITLRLVATPFRILAWILSGYTRWRFTHHRPVR
jgi:hypothetical protein